MKIICCITATYYNVVHSLVVVLSVYSLLATSWLSGLVCLDIPLLGGGQQVAGQTGGVGGAATNIVVNLVGQSFVGLNELIYLLLEVGNCLVKIVVTPSVGLAVPRVKPGAGAT